MGTTARCFCLALLCLGLSGGVNAQDANPGWSGTFYNRAQSGHGFVFEVLENGSLLVYWYSYRGDGTSTFFLGVLAPDGEGRFTGLIQQTEGMVFGDFDPDTNELIDWGDLTIEFSDCRTALATWNPTLDGFTAGSTPLERLTTLPGVNCRDSAAVGNFALSIDDGSDKFFGRAVLLPDGRFAWFNGDPGDIEVGLGEWQQSGQNGLAWSGTSYAEGETTGTPDNGSGALTRDGFFAQSSSSGIEGVLLDSTQVDLPQASLAGDYSIVDESSGGGVGNVSIDNVGRVNGTIQGLCTVSGTLTVPNRDLNQISANLDISVCDTAEVSGAGFSTADGLGDLILILVDETNGGGLLLRLIPD